MFLWLMASVLYYFNHQNSLHHHFTAWCFWSHFWRTTFVNVWVYDSSWQIFGSYLSSQFTFYRICQWMHNMTNSPVLLWCFHFMPSSSGSHLLLCGHDVQGTDVKALCLSTIELYHSRVLPHCSIYLSFLVILSSCCCDNIGRKGKKNPCASNIFSVSLNLHHSPDKWSEQRMVHVMFRPCTEIP